MHIHKTLALVLLGLSLSAAADLSVVTEAYEVEAIDLRMPPGATGIVTFKACEDCKLQTIPVTGATRYVINERNVDLTEFKKRIPGSRDAYTTIIHDLESDTITVIDATL